MNCDMTLLWVISCRYVQKLQSELETASSQLFPAPSQHQRIKSVLADLSKTASDFHHITSKALDSLANGLMPHLRSAAVCAVYAAMGGF